MAFRIANVQDIFFVDKVLREQMKSSKNLGSERDCTHDAADICSTMETIRMCKKYPDEFPKLWYTVDPEQHNGDIITLNKIHTHVKKTENKNKSVLSNGHNTQLLSEFIQHNSKRLHSVQQEIARYMQSNVKNLQKCKVKQYDELYKEHIFQEIVQIMTVKITALCKFDCMYILIPEHKERLQEIGIVMSSAMFYLSWIDKYPGLDAKGKENLERDTRAVLRVVMQHEKNTLWDPKISFEVIRLEDCLSWYIDQCGSKKIPKRSQKIENICLQLCLNMLITNMNTANEIKDWDFRPAAYDVDSADPAVHYANENIHTDGAQDCSQYPHNHPPRRQAAFEL